jgi:predicted CopG family antitoxin
MPREGFKTITVRDEIYDTLWDLWAKNRKEYAKNGITSFSGFVTKFLYEALERDEKLVQEPRAASP